MLFTFIIGQCFVSMLCAMHYGVRHSPVQRALSESVFMQPGPSLLRPSSFMFHALL